MPATDHYFSSAPQSEPDPVEISAEVRGKSLLLQSDRGVFSRERIDTGSMVLARTFDVSTAQTVLDLGCGYGFLGILAALLAPQSQVTLVDVNPRAADLARVNCRRYQLTNTEVLTGDALEVLGDRRFDAILCNPPYRVGKVQVMALLEDAAKRLTPGGALWIVGRTKQGIKTLARDLSPHFADTKTAEVKSGYRVIRFSAAS